LQTKKKEFQKNNRNLHGVCNVFCEVRAMKE
jgi:hypothetical protein